MITLHINYIKSHPTPAPSNSWKIQTLFQQLLLWSQKAAPYFAQTLGIFSAKVLAMHSKMLLRNHAIRWSHQEHDHSQRHHD